jgi:hypothetical protein
MQNIILKSFFSACGLILLLSGRALAQFEEGQASGVTNSISCTATLPSTPNLVTYTAAGEASRKIRDIVRFKMNESAPSTPGAPMQYFQSGFSATVTLKIELWNPGFTSGASPDVTMAAQTLTVNYDPAPGNKYNPIDYLVLSGTTQYEQVRVTINSISVTGFSGSWTESDILALLTVENEMDLLRYFNLSANPSNLAPSSFSGSYDGTAHGDQLSVAWAFSDSTHNNSSQLEYAWVENETKTFYNVGGAFDTSTLFRENSTRIDVDPIGNYYTFAYNIPLLYPADSVAGGGAL